MPRISNETKFVISEKQIQGFFSFSSKTNRILLDHSVTMLSESELAELKEYCIAFRKAYLSVVNEWCELNPNKRMCAVKLRRQAKELLPYNSNQSYKHIEKILSNLKDKVDRMFNEINGNMKLKLEQPKVRTFTELDTIED